MSQPIEDVDLRQLLRAGSRAMVWMSAAGTILQINQVAADNLGMDPDELVGVSIYDLLPEMADTVRERYAEVTASGAVQTYEDEVRLPDGTVRVFQSENAPIFDREGRCVGVLTTSTDVTERHETEARLADAERRFSLAMDAVRDGVWDWNVATGDFEMSPNFFALLGYTEAEVEEGRTEWFFSVLHLDDRTRVQHLLEAHFAGETAEYVAEYRWRHKNGSWRWAFARGRVVERSDDGAPVRMMGTTIDVTDRHELESRLAAAEKMEAIGRLAGGVAHDFNNLLTAILGHAEFLANQDLPPEADEDLAQIRSAAEKAAQLTAQLLSFARRRTVRPISVELRPVLDGLKGLLDPMLGENIQLRSTVAASLPNVFIDPTQLEQIIVNLVLNARDALPDGGEVVVAASLVHLNATSSPIELVPGPYVRLTVADNGVGMDGDTMSKVFEPFFSTKPVGKGTGLGLASCYGIVQQAGGQIIVESQLGVGTTFIIHLPSVDPDEVDTSETTRTVLVVEDDDLVRRTAVRALEQAGYHVLQAASGDQALALEPSLGRVVDMLVTDVVMPGMTGRTLAERLGARQPMLEVLFVSGYAHDSFPGGGLPEGTAFLQKPFTPSTLVERVQKMLED